MTGEKGIKIQLNSFATSREGSFAGGDALVPLMQTIRSLADGKSLAVNVSDFLTGNKTFDEEEEFNCRFGRMRENDMNEFMKEAKDMINRLKGVKILNGVRGQEGIDKKKFAEMIVRTSMLVSAAGNIAEMDLNPLLATKNKVIAVDARIRVDKSN